MNKIGISVLCYGVSGLLQGPKKLYTKIKSAGADGVQIVPIWFWTKSAISRFPSSAVLSFEGAWNNGSIIESFTNWHRLKRDKFLSWVYDLVLFMGMFNIPNGKVRFFGKHFPAAISIEACLPRSIRETQPDGMPTWLDTNESLVVDIFHVLERFKNKPNQALRMIEQISDRAVCIHFQYRERDWTAGYLENFFSAEGYLYDALVILLQNCRPDTPIIIEVSEGDLKNRGYTMEDLVAQIKTVRNKTM